MKHRKIAVYLDFLNIYMAFMGTDKFQDALEYIEKYIQRLMLKTSIVSKRIYHPHANMIPYRYKRWLIVHGWKIIQGPWGKDIDTCMVADIVEDSIGSSYTAFVVISGDTDFEPALQKIKRTHRTSYVLACNKTYRKTLRKACTNFQVIQPVTRCENIN